MQEIHMHHQSTRMHMNCSGFLLHLVFFAGQNKQLQETTFLWIFLAPEMHFFAYRI